MVYVHLAEGFEEIEALTVVDLFRRAGVDSKLVSVTGKLEVSGAHNIAVIADALFEECSYDNCEMIVLPGGMPGTLGLMNHRGLEEIIREFTEKNKKIAAICAAPMILGKMGLLKGKKATIYPGMEKELIDAQVIEARVVRDGNMLTARGPEVAMEFALAAVEMLCGIDVADRLREELVLK